MYSIPIRRRPWHKRLLRLPGVFLSHYVRLRGRGGGRIVAAVNAWRLARMLAR